MNITFLTVGLILLAFSFVGCVLPVVPGPVFALLGFLSLYLTDHQPSVLMTCMATMVVVISSLLDYVVPAISAKKFKCTKAGVWGCLAGSMIGFIAGTVVSFFLTPIVGAVVVLLGLVAGPFIGTMTGELLFAKRSLKEAFGGGIGALVGFVIAVAVKLLACLLLTAQFLWSWL